MTPPAHPEPDLNKQNASPKRLSTWDPNGHQKPSKWSPKASKIEPHIDQKFEKSSPALPKLSQEGARTAKRSKIKTDLTKKWGNSYRVVRFWAKKWPTWRQVGFQNRPKIDQKSMPKSIKNLMHLGIDFWEDFGGFWEPKWSQVGTKIEQLSLRRAHHSRVCHLSGCVM